MKPWAKKNGRRLSVESETPPAPEPEKITQEIVDRTMALAAHGDNVPSDTRAGARVYHLLKKHGMWKDTDPEYQLTVTQSVVDEICGTFGPMLHHLRRVKTARTFSEQQREIVYLTDKIT